MIDWGVFVFFNMKGRGMICIIGLCMVDVCFLISVQLDGLDVMNLDLDYLVVYVILEMDGLYQGYGLIFIIGCGNEICIVVIEVLWFLVVGLDLGWVVQDMGCFWWYMISDSQLCWIGLDKGVIYLVMGVVVNVVWDLWVKFEGKLVWQLVVDMLFVELVCCIDFCYFIDCIMLEWVLEFLIVQVVGKFVCIKILLVEGYFCYIISVGWLGYDDVKLCCLCCEVVDVGFCYIKMKVGCDLEDDICCLIIVCDEIGLDVNLMIDVNQVWEVDQVIDWVGKLVFVQLWFIEELISFDDIVGYCKICVGVVLVQVVIGEMCQNCIMFKQFIMEGVIDVVQIDVCCLGGLNEVLVVMLMVVKYGLKVCFYVGGVGLCEYVQYMLMIDYLCIVGMCEGWVIEFVDYLYEYFLDFCIICDVVYMLFEVLGFLIQMYEVSFEIYCFWGV